MTTLAQEMKHNSFFRLDQARIIAGLRPSFPDLPEQPDSETVFIKLRELRDRW